MVEVSTSILSVKKGEESKTFFALETAKTDYFHIDIMDGKFVEKDTYDRMIQNASYIKRISSLPLDVHLMVKDVKAAIDDFLAVEPNIITFHLEAANNKEQVLEWIKLIKENNVRVGISVKPDTKIEEVKDFLSLVHLVLVMTVEPGKGGQELIPKTVEKIRALKRYVQDKQLEVDIEADGGINLETVEIVKEAGVDIIVSGSCIVNSNNYLEVVEKLKK